MKVKTSRIEELASKMLCAGGMAAVARWMHSRQLLILMFHGVEAEPPSPPCDWVIDAATLRRNLAWLRRRYHVLPLVEALERLGDGSLPRRAAVVTFDDGTANLLTHAAPVLRDLGVPAAVFLATGPMGTAELLWADRMWLAFARTTRTEVDLSSLGLGLRAMGSDNDRAAARDLTIARLKELPDAQRLAEMLPILTALGQDGAAGGELFRLLSWREAGELARDGLVSLHPHSVTHPILARCGDAKVDYEIAESCRALRINTGRTPTIFAYPNGGEQDVDERTRQALERNGIRWALSTIEGFANAESDPLLLPRVGVSPHQTLPQFVRRTSGLALRPRHRRGSTARQRTAHHVGPEPALTVNGRTSWSGRT
ncbi:polysaccharide deacetylase [Mycobacterium sp. SWH-M1]|nr:polysaccharide deacetylase [Mycobacterium sp. SWH-M1]